MTSIVDEVLTKRPYVRVMVPVLNSNNTITSEEERSKYARECLKNLQSEDLVYLHVVDAMSQYETVYTNINGNSFENEMAKIMLRYKNEGKPAIQEGAPFNERK